MYCQSSTPSLDLLVLARIVEMRFLESSVTVLCLLARCTRAAPPGSVSVSSNSTSTTSSRAAHGTASVIASGTTIPAGYTPSPPVPPPKYMVDNQNNFFHAAPDAYSPDLIDVTPSPNISNAIVVERDSSFDTLENRQATGSSFWLANMGHGSVRIPHL